MLSYPLKCRKNTEGKNKKFVKTKNGKISFYQNVPCAIVNNKNVSNSKKLVDY